MKRFSILIITISALTGLLGLNANVADAQPQDRSFIRQKISQVGGCRNVAITRHNGDLMLYGQNGWAASGCPKSLTDALDKHANNGEYIDDVQLTEEGRWLILLNDNEFQWNDIPYSLEKQLRYFNELGEIVTSVTFNDSDDWIVITTEHFIASDQEIMDLLAEGAQEYGQIWATCITEDALVVVFEQGYYTFGNIPPTLSDALQATDIDVYRIKIAGDAWFFSDGSNDYDYNM